MKKNIRITVDRSGIEHCSWIEETDYDVYYQTLHNFVSQTNFDTDTLVFINKFIKRKLYSTTQHLAKINRNQKFYRRTVKINEVTVDEYVEIFGELGAILENYLKLLYGILHNYRTDKEIEQLEKTIFYDIWKGLKSDSGFKSFTSKSFPNTIYWNASKLWNY